MERALLPAAVAIYFAVCLAWPAWRLWRGHGVVAVVFQRDAEPWQRLIGALLFAMIGGLFVWAGLFAGVGPERLGVWSVPPVVRGAGWALVALGTALTFVAQANMGASLRIGIDDRPTELVTRGLFRVSRNPIFTGMLVALAGMVAIAPAPCTLAGWLVAAAVIGVQVRFEERHLLALHGDRYRAYGRAVGRFSPWLGRLSGRA